MFAVPFDNCAHAIIFNASFLHYGVIRPLIIAFGISVPDMQVLEGKAFRHLNSPMNSNAIMRFGIHIHGGC